MFRFTFIPQLVLPRSTHCCSRSSQAPVAPVKNSCNTMRDMMQVGVLVILALIQTTTVALESDGRGPWSQRSRRSRQSTSLLEPQQQSSSSSQVEQPSDSLADWCSNRTIKFFVSRFS